VHIVNDHGRDVGDSDCGYDAGGHDDRVRIVNDHGRDVGDSDRGYGVGGHDDRVHIVNDHGLDVDDYDRGSRRHDDRQRSRVETGPFRVPSFPPFEPFLHCSTSSLPRLKKFL
jgi:hypothetical protein